MRIGQMNRDNVNGYLKLVNSMNQKKGSKSKNPLEDCQSGNFALRNTPTDVPFSKPNWDKIPTKRQNPSMSEAELEVAIREEARRAFARNRSDREAYSTLSRKYMEFAAPDRKAIYEESMKKTGGKMNAALAFYNKSGQEVLAYNPYAPNGWFAMTTDAEWARRQEFCEIYNGEMDRLIAKYGKGAMGNMSYADIQKDVEAESGAPQGRLDKKI